MRIVEHEISSKILSIKVFIQVEEDLDLASLDRWTVGIHNGVGSSHANVLFVTDAQLGPWTDWSHCSKSCIGLDEKYGQLILLDVEFWSIEVCTGFKSRRRRCKDGKNGGTTCQSLDQPLSEKRICAGDNPRVPKICPVPLTWTDWTPWTNCSAKCGPGAIKQRTRSCIPGRYGGQPCRKPFERQVLPCPTKASQLIF